MKNISIALSALVLLMLGCTSKIYVEKDPSTNLNAYRTYMWVPTSSDQNNDHLRDRPTAFAEQAVHSAAAAELSKLGWREVSSNPDLLLSYDILVQRNREQETNPVYTTPYVRYYYNPWIGRWGTIYFPSQFMGYESYSVPVREATFTLNMTDARTDKTVWQGWTTEDIQNRRPSAQEIHATVKRILKKLETNKE